MGAKYIAYLDILGFKNWMSMNDIYDADKYLTDYSATFKEVWESEDTSGMNCYMVSDCSVLYTDDIDKGKLKKLLNVVVKASQTLFLKNDILVRGAICKGDFETIDHGAEGENIKIQIFTGEAYIDAYTLEDKIKVAGIMVSEEVKKDIDHHVKDIKTVTVKNGELIRTFSIEYLLRQEVLERFIGRAIEARWIAHYHNTLYAALYNNSKAKGIFDKVIDQIEALDNKGQGTKEFLLKAFEEDVEDNYKGQLSTYLREKILMSKKLLLDNNGNYDQ